MSNEQSGGRRFRIGELAALSGVTPRALRLYEARGLLAEPQRTESGYRLYGTAELVRAIRIRRLRALGMSLEQIAGVLADDADPGLLPDQLELLRDELRRRAALLAKAADEVSLLVGLGEEAAWRELLAAAEQGAELEDAQRLAGQAEGPAALAALLADPGWKQRWQPLAQRLHALRDADPDDPQVTALAGEVARLLPRSVLPDEASPPDRLELFLGRRYGAAQVRCLHLARALLDEAPRPRR
jgi:DNA-binding transcriptional MerR regulator